jgi:hypothetical protein
MPGFVNGASRDNARKNNQNLVKRLGKILRASRIAEYFSSMTLHYFAKPYPNTETRLHNWREKKPGRKKTYYGSLEGKFFFNDFTFLAKPDPNAETRVHQHHLVLVQGILVEVVLFLNVHSSWEG